MDGAGTLDGPKRLASRPQQQQAKTMVSSARSVVFVVNSPPAGQSTPWSIARVEDRLHGFATHPALVEEERHLVPCVVSKHVLAARFGLLESTYLPHAECGKERAGDFSVQGSVDQYWSALAPYLGSS
jgi:hypothetical protein